MAEQIEFIEIELVHAYPIIDPRDCLDEFARIIADVIRKSLEAGTMIIVDGVVQLNPNIEEVGDGIQFSELPAIAGIPSVGVSA